MARTITPITAAQSLWSFRRRSLHPPTLVGELPEPKRVQSTRSLVVEVPVRSIGPAYAELHPGLNTPINSGSTTLEARGVNSGQEIGHFLKQEYDRPEVTLVDRFLLDNWGA